jgi:hypothetical protein
MRIKDLSERSLLIDPMIKYSQVFRVGCELRICEVLTLLLRNMHLHESQVGFRKMAFHTCQSLMVPEVGI